MEGLCILTVAGWPPFFSWPDADRSWSFRDEALLLEVGSRAAEAVRWPVLRGADAA